ncbi:hypothetical protein EFA69_05070 [Rufibacter immobilis]|uniref:STAS/SEC14 domain-containing protein n=1 Tax=Rufibacter immobilis TaxID=1348778 RepID=A0A3M9N272_9BACT|nr:hypothetical protein [Rufibacter immobilis]RNI31884.1 hypothetical protein EFA69_05070 [Rufibacter immobilis]
MKQDTILLQHTALYEITLHTLDQILKLNWVKPPSTADYRSGTLLFLDMIRQYNIKKIMSDNTHRGYPSPLELLWLSHRIIPVLCQTEVQQLAVVVPQDPNHARTLECCLMTSEVCYELQFFYTAADALDWLRKTPSHFNGKAVA